MPPSDLPADSNRAEIKIERRALAPRVVCPCCIMAHQAPVINENQQSLGLPLMGLSPHSQSGVLVEYSNRRHAVLYDEENWSFAGGRPHGGSSRIARPA